MEPATQVDIRQWFAEGKREGATHMIVVCDSFSYEDYPVFVKPGQDARTVAAEYDGKNMQRIMEVYNLALDLEQQLSEFRVFNY